MIRHLLASCLLTTPAFAAQPLPIIPAPESVTVTPGAPFRLGPATSISCDAGLLESGRYLAAELAKLTPLTPNASIASPAPPPHKDIIALALEGGPGTPGGYRLTVAADGVRIASANQEGVFHGVQTLLQLVPRQASADTSFALPACVIKDAPRFAWRGLMLNSPPRAVRSPSTPARHSITSSKTRWTPPTRKPSNC